VCEYDTDVVLFAGRERDLPELITAMTGHQCREDKTRLIAIGTTGVGRTRGDPDVVANLRRANITIVDAASVNLQGMPSAGDVLQQLKNLRSASNPVPAAGGDLTFGTDGWPECVEARLILVR
jgi:hypothetical protein